MEIRDKIKAATPRMINAWLLFAAVTIIITAFVLYWFVYVRNNENQQTDNRFRALAQIGQNIYYGEETLKGNTQKEFLSRLERPDVFDHLIVLKEEERKNNDGKLESKLSVLYHTMPEGFDIVDFGNLRTIPPPLKPGVRDTITIANKSYRLFMQPLKLKDDSKRYIFGIIDEKKFNRQVQGLESDMVVYLLSGFLIVFFCIPIVKLFLMSSFDQLKINDVVLTALAVILCILSLILLNFASYQNHDDIIRIDKELETLAKGIETNFSRELKDMVNTLDAYETHFSDEPELHEGDIIHNVLGQFKLERVSPQQAALLSLPINESKIKEKLDTLNKRETAYNLYKNIFWMNEDDQQVLQFSTRNYIKGQVNPSYMIRFTGAGNWSLAEDSTTHFYVESIPSITSDEKLVAISKSSKMRYINKEGQPQEAVVAVMTSPAATVIDPIMPIRYGFCIIDKNGQVWFHSDKGRNLQENFFAETDEDTKLRAAIDHRQPEYFNVNYQSKSHRAHIAPLVNSPLFLITFHDKTYTQAIESTIISDTVKAILAMVLFSILLFLVSAGVNYHQSQLKHRYVPFDWLRPHTDDLSAACYEHLIISNSIILLLLIFFTLFTTPMVMFFLCLSANLFAFIYNQYVIYRTSGQGFGFKIGRHILVLLGFLLVIHIMPVLISQTGLHMRLLLFQGVLAVVLIVWSRVKPKLSQATSGQNPDMLEQSVHPRSGRYYIWFLSSWLVLSGIVPMIIFFNGIYNSERISAYHLTQSQLFQQKMARDLQIDDFYEKQMDREKDNALIKATQDLRKGSGIYADIPEKKPGEAIKTPQKNPAPNLVSFRSRLKGTPFIVFIIATIGILFFVYFIFKFVARHLFGLDSFTPYTHSPQEPKSKETEPAVIREIHQYIRAGSPMIIQCQTGEQLDYFSHLQKEILLPGLGTESTSHPLDKFRLEECDFPAFQSEDVAVLTGAAPASESCRVLRIPNFDSYMADIDTIENLKNKLVAVKKLVSIFSDPHFLVIMPMVIPMVELIYSYQDAGVAQAGEIKKADSAKKEIPKDMLEKRILLQHITDLLKKINLHCATIVVPLKLPGEHTPNYKKIYPIKHRAIKQLILDEFKPSAFFATIEADVYDYYIRQVRNQNSGQWSNDELETSKEEIILKIQQLSHHYYLKLWKSCTRKEKFVLYDISQDRLINFKNRETLSQLFKKGLLKNEGVLEVMNRSFRNFILTAVEKTEAHLLLGELNIHSQWKSYQAPIYLLILGAAVFLAFQQNLLTDLDALITAIIGGLGILTKFSGIFSTLPFGKKS